VEDFDLAAGDYAVTKNTMIGLTRSQYDTGRDRRLEAISFNRVSDTSGGLDSIKGNLHRRSFANHHQSAGVNSI
jgi:hypothetical protein